MYQLTVFLDTAVKSDHNVYVTDLRETVRHLFHPRHSNNHRPRILHPLGFVWFSVLVMLIVGAVHLLGYAPGNAGSILGYASEIVPTDVIVQTNNRRAQLGLPPLQPNQQLTQAAKAKAAHMIGQQYWAHTAPDGTEPWYFIKSVGYRYSNAGENLAKDFSRTESMVRAWMESPTHRANIVNPDYTEIGIAVLDGELHGFETTLVVQMFGDQRQQPSAVGNTAAATGDSASETIGAVRGTEPIPSPDSITGETVERVAVVQAAPEEFSDNSQVLAASLVPIGSIERPPLFTPLQLSKAFFLAVILLVSSTLVYDFVIIEHRQATRLVGKNLAHIVVFMALAFLVLFFEGGMIR